MGQIVNRGFQPEAQNQQNGPMMGGQMQDYQMQNMQSQNPSQYMPPQDMQGAYQPLSSIPEGAASEGHAFAQQASMFRDARDMGRMGSPYGDNSQDMMQGLGELFGMGGGNPVYNEPYGNPQETMYGEPYGASQMQFPVPDDTSDVYGPFSRPYNLGSFGEY